MPVLSAKPDAQATPTNPSGLPRTLFLWAFRHQYQRGGPGCHVKNCEEGRSDLAGDRRQGFAHRLQVRGRQARHIDSTLADDIDSVIVA
jgi:hypothetical protein